MTEALLDAAAVAKMLGISRRAVYDLSSEDLPFVIVGKRSRRWDPADVRRYIRDQRHAVVRLSLVGGA